MPISCNKLVIAAGTKLPEFSPIHRDFSPKEPLNRKRVFEYAAQHRLPAIYEFDWLVRDGGLMSYAPDLDESFGRVAALVDLVLKGSKPADLPFEQPTRFKFAINLKVTKALGLEVPPMLLATADEVIE